MVKTALRTKPGFTVGPSVFPSYIVGLGQFPELDFSPGRDISAEVWGVEAGEKRRLMLSPLTAQNMKKGQRITVAWPQAQTLPNGDYDFQIIMADRYGNRAEYYVPFTIYIINNPNRTLIIP